LETHNKIKSNCTAKKGKDNTENDKEDVHHRFDRGEEVFERREKLGIGRLSKIWGEGIWRGGVGERGSGEGNRNGRRVDSRDQWEKG
jgi:hypothetical protein